MWTFLFDSIEGHLVLVLLAVPLAVVAYYAVRLWWAWLTLPWAVLRRLDDLIDQRRG